MISEVDRVHRTVDSLLSLARPRSLTRTPTDLGRLVPRATALPRREGAGAWCNAFPRARRRPFPASSSTPISSSRSS